MIFSWLSLTPDSLMSTKVCISLVPRPALCQSGTETSSASVWYRDQLCVSLVPRPALCQSGTETSSIFTMLVLDFSLDPDFLFRQL